MSAARPGSDFGLLQEGYSLQRNRPENTLLGCLSCWQWVFPAARLKSMQSGWETGGSPSSFGRTICRSQAVLRLRMSPGSLCVSRVKS